MKLWLPLLLALSTPAFAGSVPLKDTNNATHTFDTVTEAGGNEISKQAICDQAAAANCATVDALKQLAVGLNAGSLAAGAAVDGWNITMGAKADAAWVSGSGSLVSLNKTIATNTAAPIPTGANVIGGITIADGSDNTLGARADVAWVSGSGSVVALLKAISGLNTTIAAGVQAAIPAQANVTTTIGQVGSEVNITPTDCSIALTTGGTAQNIIAAAATRHGFTIANIDAAAGSGEPIWISFTGTAVAAAIGSYPLAAPTATTYAGLSSYTAPFGLGINTAVSVIAATTGHKISCTVW